MSKTFDKIHIRDLKLRCIIGINPDERVEKQDVVINITLVADLSQACQSDDIKDTVDYANIKKEILKMAEQSQFLLVEAMAQAVTDICLRNKRVEQATVSIEKPTALRFARTVGVEITRYR